MAMEHHSFEHILYGSLPVVKQHGGLAFLTPATILFYKYIQPALEGCGTSYSYEQWSRTWLARGKRGHGLTCTILTQHPLHQYLRQHHILSRFSAKVTLVAAHVADLVVNSKGGCSALVEILNESWVSAPVVYA